MRLSLAFLPLLPGILSVESYCDSNPFDDRVPSTDVRVGRIQSPGGGATCSAFLIEANVFVTSRTGPGGQPCVVEGSRIHFTNEPGDAPRKDQYAINFSTYKTSAGYSDSWGVGRLAANEVTGLQAGTAQTNKCGENASGCGWLSVGPVPAEGSVVRVTGYGTCDAGKPDRPQQTDTGTLTYSYVGADRLWHDADTRGGSHGSPIIDEATGYAVGIQYTSQEGTRFDSPGLPEVLLSFMDCRNDSTWKYWRSSRGPPKGCGWAGRNPYHDERCQLRENTQQDREGGGRRAFTACKRVCNGVCRTFRHLL